MLIAAKAENKHMKKIIVIVCLFLVVTAMGQNNGKACQIKGHVQDAQSKEVLFFKFDKSFEASIPLDEKGDFSGSLNLKEPGIYFIKVGTAYTNIFLKNSYNLTVNTDIKTFAKSMEFKGEGADFNQYIKARAELKGNLVGDAKTFFVVPCDSFLARVDNMALQMKQQLAKTKLDKEDVDMAQKFIEYDYLLTRNNYQKFYVFHAKQEPFIPANYLDPIKNLDMNDAVAYNNSMDYRYLIIEKWRLKEAEAKKANPNHSIIDFTGTFAEQIHYEPIRDQVVRMVFNKVDARNADFEAMYLKIKPLVRVEKTKEELETRLNTARTNAKGMASATFDFENHKGGTTSLASLRGKYVYIDIWATWCGPCVREFPELTKLIADYKGNPQIEFVCISIDSKDDYQKWRDFVTDKKVGGQQLIADKGLESSFMKFLNVSLIPRNVLIDPQGKIISSAGLRPSDKNTRETLAKYVGAPVIKLSTK